jgi:hypothetical protein
MRRRRKDDYNCLEICCYEPLHSAARVNVFSKRYVVYFVSVSHVREGLEF